MEEYYQIIHFLDNHSLDRIYPVEDYFYETDDEGNRSKITFAGDSFLFITNRHDYNGLDYIEVLIESNTNCNVNELSLNLSEYIEGYSPVAVFTPDDEFQLDTGVPTRVVFTVRRSMNMSEASREYTNIRSIELITPDNTDFIIYDICFRNANASFSLEQMDKFYEDGKYYVLSQLHMKDVPDDLINYIYTAAAGYAWNSKWEFDARIMNDEQKNALSYGKWLFAHVDKAIDEYKKANGILDDDKDYVKDDIVTHIPLKY